MRDGLKKLLILKISSMVRIIPALLAKDKDDFLHRAKIVADIVDLVQIDVLDGTFLPEKSWAKADDVGKLKLPLFFEIHLMVNHPETKIAEWAKLADRIFFHFEAAKNSEVCISEIKRYNKKAGLAINPETTLADIIHLLPTIDCLLVMGVYPGKMGLSFLPETIEKIKQIKNQFPKLEIEVDGGVKEEHLLPLYEAGVRDFVIGSGIFKSPNPAAALKEYLKIVEQCDKRSALKT